MTPSRMYGPSMPYGFDMSEQLRKQDRAWRVFIHSASVFLGEAFPHAKVEAYQMCEAFIDLMCAGTEEQLKALEAHRPRPEEYLIHLTSERDQILSQIEQFEEGMERMPEPLQPICALWKTSVLVPLRQRLEYVDQQIEQEQRTLETEPAR